MEFTLELKNSKETATSLREEPNKLDDQMSTKGRKGNPNVAKAPIKNEIPQDEYCAKNLRIHVYDRPATFKCCECNEMFPNRTSKWRHEKRFHSKNGSTPNSEKAKRGSFECPICGKILSYAASLWRHKNKVHSEDRPYLCSMCDQSYKLLDHLQRHLARHVEERSHICNICGAAFNVKYHLNRHLKRHEGVTRFECRSCDKRFYDKSSRDKHEKTHKNVGERHDLKHICKICGRGFVSKFSLGIHQENTHSAFHRNLSNGEEIIQKVHRRRSSGSELRKEQIFQCEICSKVMSTGHCLIKHMKSHTGEDTLTCSVCLKVIKGGIKRLENHKRIHTGEKPFKCQYCDKTSNDKGWIGRHENSHTKEKKYLCPVCSKIFYDPAIRSRHVKIHTDSDEFKCESCTKTFRRKDYLKRHQLTHTKFKPYKCNHCENCFKEKRSVQNHVKKIHKRNGSQYDYSYGIKKNC